MIHLFTKAFKIYDYNLLHSNKNNKQSSQTAALKNA